MSEQPRDPATEIGEVAAALCGMSAILRMIAEEHTDNEPGRTDAIYVVANLADTLNARLDSIKLPQ